MKTAQKTINKLQIGTTLIIVGMLGVYISIYFLNQNFLITSLSIIIEFIGATVIIYKRISDKEITKLYLPLVLTCIMITIICIYSYFNIW